ncbi:MAG: M20/M25/M40 family metallo-hydrolase [Streptosporangiales bacterium]
MSSGSGQEAPTDVFDHIDARTDGYVERLLDYVSHPSVSASGEGVAEVADYICAFVQEIGLDARLVPTEGAPMVYGDRHESDELPTILFYGHYDVQPPEPLDQWVTPPFEPSVRDGRVYARGVGDNKGQHLAQLFAIDAFLQCRKHLPCNVKVLLEGEEEIGSPRMLDFVREHGDLLRADLMVISDGPVDSTGRAKVSLGVRGVLSIELRAAGADADLHSGHWGNVAPEPMWDLVHLLATMKDGNGRVLVDGFYDDVEPLSAAEQDALDRLPIDVEEIKRGLGVSEFAAPRDRAYAERLTGWPTLTINGFHGGYGGAGPKTVLPREGVVKCDIRLVEAQTADDIFAKVSRHVQQHAPGVQVVRHGGSMEPSKTPVESPYVEPVRRAVVAAQGEDPVLWPAGGGSLPLYAFSKVLGIPTIEVPYGSPDQANHAPNENMELRRFTAGIRTGAAMLQELGAVRGH